MNLWKPLGNSPGLIVQLHSIRKDSPTYQIYSRYILDAATNLFDAYKHTLIQGPSIPQPEQQVPPPKFNQMDTIRGNDLQSTTIAPRSNIEQSSTSKSSVASSQTDLMCSIKDMEIEETTKGEANIVRPEPISTVAHEEKVEQEQAEMTSAPSHNTVQRANSDAVMQSSTMARIISPTSLKKSISSSIEKPSNDYKVLPTQMQKMRRFRRQAHSSPSSSFNLDANMKMRSSPSTRKKLIRKPLPSSAKNITTTASSTINSNGGNLDKHSNHSNSGSLNSGIFSIEMPSLPSRSASFNSRISVEMNNSIPSSGASFSSQLSLELLSLSSRSNSLSNTLLNLEILTLPSSAASFSSHNSNSMKLHSLPSRSASFTSCSQNNSHNNRCNKNNNSCATIRRNSLPLRSASLNSHLSIDLPLNPSSSGRENHEQNKHDTNNSKSHSSFEWHTLPHATLDEAVTASVFSTNWGNEDRVPLDISVHASIDGSSHQRNLLHDKDMICADTTHSSHSPLPPSTIFLNSLTN